MKDTVYLALGSNRGNRLKFLREALKRLDANEEVWLCEKSAVYESASVEGGGEGDFLNAVLRLETTLSPSRLLTFIQIIEQQLGRAAPPRHGPRCIDIDILFFEKQTFRSEQLQLPHPRMHYRPFVLQPLLDVLHQGSVKKTEQNW